MYCSPPVSFGLSFIRHSSIDHDNKYTAIARLTTGDRSLAKHFSREINTAFNLDINDQLEGTGSKTIQRYIFQQIYICQAKMVILKCELVLLVLSSCTQCFSL